MSELAYHQVMGLLGWRDLHPGGREVSQRIVKAIQTQQGDRPTTILEVGAGAGGTTARLLTQGWRVHAVEPDPILNQLLPEHPDLHIHPCGLLQTDIAPESMEYAIAESVLYSLDIFEAFKYVYLSMKPGGVLIFSEQIWTREISQKKAEHIHDMTLRDFGIAMGARKPWTWKHWESALHEAGFAIKKKIHLNRKETNEPTPPRKRDLFMNSLRHPGALAALLRYHQHIRNFSLSDSLTESILCVAEK
ncbi:MAG: methyltransferase domain-containing protein [Myxococcota bacterium]